MDFVKDFVEVLGCKTSEGLRAQSFSKFPGGLGFRGCLVTLLAGTIGDIWGYYRGYIGIIEKKMETIV